MGANGNEALQKNELLQRLEAISVSQKKALSIKSKMDNFTPEDNYERKVVVPLFPGEYDNEDTRESWMNAINHQYDGAVEQMAKRYDYYKSPKEPKKPIFDKKPISVTSETDQVNTKHGCLPWAGGVIGVIFLGNVHTLPAFLTWPVMAICVSMIGYYFYMLFQAKKKDADVLKQKQKKHRDTIAHQTAEYENAVAVYESECASFKLRRHDFLTEYSKWRDIYLESLKEESEIAEKLEADRQASVKKIYDEEFTPALDELAQVNDNLVANDYLNAVDVFIDLLKSGRADSLKEAINRYEEIVYRERQLQLQREQEEQRRYEEARRREDEERHYQEQIRFQQEQERHRQYEANQQLKMQEQQHRENMRLQEKLEQDRKNAEREERRRREKEELNKKMEESSAIRRQCNRCALNGRCSMAYRRSNCASFTPR